MADWMNSSLKKFEKTVTVPLEKAEELYRSIPENAVVTAENRNLKSIKVKYVLTNELTQDRIKQLNSKEVPIKVVSIKQNKKYLDSVMCIVNIADFHLNRKVWGKSAYGKDYNIQIAKKVFKETIDKIVERLLYSPYKIERIVLNTAGDLLNSDTIEGTTVHGTLQEDDTSWQEAFIVAKELLVYAVVKLGQVGLVQYQYIAGNHDKMSSYYLVSWLAAKFNKNKTVVIDENPKTRQIITYGTNVIILAHGDTESSRAIDLPFIEPEARKLVSNSTNIEVLTGHVHQSSVTNKNGVRWETLNISCPVACQWSTDMGFSNLSSEVTINYYNKTHRVQQDTIDTQEIYRNVSK